MMQLVLLLLIYHAPEYIFAHLEFIHFHTINDERYSALLSFYVIFKSSLNQILETSPRARIKEDRLSPFDIAPAMSFHSFIWGFVNRQVETFPIICESLEGKHILSVSCGDKHMVALTSKCSFL